MPERSARGAKQARTPLCALKVSCSLARMPRAHADLPRRRRRRRRRVCHTPLPLAGDGAALPASLRTMRATSSWKRGRTATKSARRVCLQVQQASDMLEQARSKRDAARAATLSVRAPPLGAPHRSVAGRMREKHAIGVGPAKVQIGILAKEEEEQERAQARVCLCVCALGLSRDRKWSGQINCLCRSTGSQGGPTVCASEEAIVVIQY